MDITAEGKSAPAGHGSPLEVLRDRGRASERSAQRKPTGSPAHLDAFLNGLQLV
jgi:hypothetical protein